MIRAICGVITAGDNKVEEILTATERFVKEIDVPKLYRNVFV
ncbi:hypothetical protein AALF16_15220 [Bacillus cereus]